MMDRPRDPTDRHHDAPSRTARPWLDLNRASDDALRALDGLPDDVLDELLYRRGAQLFGSLDELLALEGVTPQIVESIRKQNVRALPLPRLDDATNLSALLFCPSEDCPLPAGRQAPGTPLADVFTGLGVALSGLAALLRQDDPPKKDDPPAKEEPPKPKPLFDGTNVTVDGDVGTEGNPAKITDEVKKKAVGEPVMVAKATVAAIVDLFRRAGIFNDLDAQLKKDGLKERIVIKVQVEDAWAVISLHAHTQCGDPIVISINISDVLDWTVLDRVLAHELVHAKECAYTAAGKEAPYGGHDAEKFKDKVKAFEKMAKDQLDKDEAKSKAEMEKLLKEKGK